MELITFGDDYLGFQPVLISDSTDSYEAIKALGNLKIDLYEIVATGISSANDQIRSSTHVLSTDSHQVPESKKSKISSVQTVSAGAARMKSTHAYRAAEKLITLQGRYGTADNFFLRHILPEQFIGLITSSGFYYFSMSDLIDYK